MLTVDRFEISNCQFKLTRNLFVNKQKYLAPHQTQETTLSCTTKGSECCQVSPATHLEELAYRQYKPLTARALLSIFLSFDTGKEDRSTNKSKVSFPDCVET